VPAGKLPKGCRVRELSNLFDMCGFRGFEACECSAIVGTFVGTISGEFLRAGRHSVAAESVINAENSSGA